VLKKPTSANIVRPWRNSRNRHTWFLEGLPEHGKLLLYRHSVADKEELSGKEVKRRYLPEGSVVGEAIRGGHGGHGRAGRHALRHPQPQAAPGPRAPHHVLHPSKLDGSSALDVAGEGPGEAGDRNPRSWICRTSSQQTKTASSQMFFLTHLEPNVKRAGVSTLLSLLTVRNGSAIPTNTSQPLDLVWMAPMNE
jgi:hypothetical protein